MTIEVLARPPRQTSRSTAGVAYETHCVTCARAAYALGGGSLWCAHCLGPYINKGQAFQAELSLRGREQRRQAGEPVPAPFAAKAAPDTSLSGSGGLETGRCDGRRSINERAAGVLNSPTA